MSAPIKGRRWSHSALEDFSSCGEKFRLKRVVKVPSVPLIAGVGGSAFHTATEHYDREGFMPDWVEVLEDAVKAEEVRSGQSRDVFRATGRVTKETPNKQDLTYWRDKLGPEMLDLYKDWRDNCDWTIARDLPPDENGNTDGIEYKVRVSIGGVTIVSIIDRIEYDIHGNLGVNDIKTWSRKRTSTQLPTYLLALNKWGVLAQWGAYYEARKGAATEPVFYSSWDENKLGHLYAQAAAVEAAGYYQPRVSDDCGWCTVRAHCAFAL